MGKTNFLKAHTFLFSENVTFLIADFMTLLFFGYRNVYRKLIKELRFKISDLRIEISELRIENSDFLISNF